MADTSRAMAFSITFVGVDEDRLPDFFSRFAAKIKAIQSNENWRGIEIFDASRTLFVGGFTFDIREGDHPPTLEYVAEIWGKCPPPSSEAAHG